MGMFDMGARSMVLLPRDTGPTPETAAAAANDAIDKGAELILGPLLANDVRAVAPVARARNVPVIAFSTDRTVAGDGVSPPGALCRRWFSRASDTGVAMAESARRSESEYGNSLRFAPNASRPTRSLLRERSGTSSA